MRNQFKVFGWLCVAFLPSLMISPQAMAAGLILAANFWEPFTGESLPQKGIASQIVREALAQQGHSAEIIIMPWARLLRVLEQGQVDGVVAIWATKERREFTHLSDPYYVNQLCLVKQKEDKFTYQGLDSLQNKLVGVGRGYDYSDQLMNSSLFSRAEAVTLGQNLARLARKRIDLVLSDCVIAGYYLKNLHGDIAQKLTLMPSVVESSPLYFGMSKQTDNGEQIVQDFNQGLASLKASGRYNTIMQKWQVSAK